MSAHLQNASIAEPAVHPHESSVTQPAPASDGDTWFARRDSEVLFRHRGWLPARDRIWDALLAAGVPEARQRRFAYCGAYAWILRDPANPDAFKVSSSYCRDRFCTPCQRARAHQLVDALTSQMPTENLRFVTLTLKHTLLPLGLQLQKLTLSFRKLRGRVLWSSRTKGGVAFIEVKRDETGTYWHPHLHLVIEGSYLYWKDLSNAWKQITKDSYIVDIRTVASHRQLIRYLLKYASKPFASSLSSQPSLLSDTILALAGRRIAFTFGAWRAFKLTDRKRPSVEWTPVAPLWRVLADAANGDQHATSLLASLTENDLCPRNHSPPK